MLYVMEMWGVHRVITMSKGGLHDGVCYRDIGNHYHGR